MMKSQKLLVIMVSVCLMAFFNVLSFAQAAQVPDDAAKTLTNTLEKQGYDVNSIDSSVQFTTSQGKVVDLNFEKNGVTLSVDGNEVSRRKPKLDDNRPGEEDDVYLKAEDDVEDDINVVECLLLAVNVYGLQLNICEFDTAGLDFLCIPESTFDFALNVLRCVGNIVD